MNNNIFYGVDVFSRLEKYISDLKSSSVFILTDENVNRLCLPLLMEKCPSLKDSYVIEISPGEEEKNLTTTARIISLLLENNADRKSLFLNFGGGVISDLGGFVSSIYKRGLGFINIPTTLLAMVDASIGGKNGIDFLDRKNIVGTFSNPGAVFIYPEFIRTLAPKHVRSGYAEIIKHILLSDNTVWEKYKNNPGTLLDERNLPDLIEHSIVFKTGITENDFKEEGRRKILNFGHTYGHAIESYSILNGQTLSHGEAVAIGMTGELFLSKKLAGFPESELTLAIHFIKSIYNDVFINFSPEDLIPFLYADKKNSRDKIAFSLLKSPGNPSEILYPDLELIVEGLIFLSEEFSRAVVE